MDTHAQHEKAFLIIRVFFIEELNGEFVIEDSLRFLERNLMLFQVRSRFALVPFKLNHMYIVCKKCVGSSGQNLGFA